MSQRNILTIPQFSEHNPAFSQNATRWLVFKAKENGLEAARAIVRVGRRVYIDQDRFFEWLDKNQSAA